MSYLVEFDLAEDLDHPGCPICRASARVGWEYLRSLLASDITDARVRDRLRHAGGLCREHLWWGVEVASAEDDPMGMALLGQLLLEVAGEALARATRPQRRRPRAKAFPARCPVCEAEAVVENAYADLLLTTSRDRLVSALSVPERGLCLPHVLVALSRPGAQTSTAALVEAWSSSTRPLAQLLAELIRKRSYQYQDEPAGEEAGSWRHVPEWLAGAARLPPSPRRRRSPERLDVGAQLSGRLGLLWSDLLEIAPDRLRRDYGADHVPEAWAELHDRLVTAAEAALAHLGQAAPPQGRSS